MTMIKWGGIALLAFVAACSSDDTSKKSGSDSGTPSGWKAVVGDDGTFAQTFDGKTWQTRSLAAADLYAVTCVGNADGWAVGAKGTVVRTHDGGETWHAEDAHTSVTLRSVHFSADHHTASERLIGVVAGDAGTLAVSTNGGDVWTPIATGTQATLRSVGASLEAGLFVVVGDGGTLLRSSDGGANFETGSIPSAADLTGVAVRPLAELVLVSDASGKIWASHDLGKSFSLEATAPGKLEAIAVAADGSRALAVGDAGILLRRDAAGHWTNGASGVQTNLLAALVTLDGARDYVAGSDGVLLGTSDQGKTFQVEPLTTTRTLRGMEDLDPH